MTGTTSAVGDARTINNTLRHQYRVLDGEEKAAVARIKGAGEAFLEALDHYGAQAGRAALEKGCAAPDFGRAFAIARTKIEEAVMWAVKGITQ